MFPYHSARKAAGDEVNDSDEESKRSRMVRWLPFNMCVCVCVCIDIHAIRI